MQFVKNPFAREFYTIEIFNEESFKKIDMDKVRRSITRFLIRGDVHNELILRKHIEIVKKEAYAFAYVDDRRVGEIPIRDSVSLSFNPLDVLKEYINKSPSNEGEKLKDKLIHV